MKSSRDNYNSAKHHHRGLRKAAPEVCWRSGLLALPAAPAIFWVAWCVYSNERKTAWADVPPDLIASKGAVSPEVAVALADGIRRRVGSALGVGVTGIAGPGGGSEENPVGTVHVSVGSQRWSVRARP